MGASIFSFFYVVKEFPVRDSSSPWPKYCYSELRNQDSCRWKEKCYFSHDIPEELRVDKTAQAELFQEKEKNVGKCVNEYRKKDSCRKGKWLCRFSHDISEEDRTDPVLKAEMDHKYQTIINPEKKSKTTSSTGAGLTIDAVQKLFTQFLTQLNTPILSNNP